MDVKTIIVNELPRFVGKPTLDEMYKTMQREICISFNPHKFFLFKDEDDFYIPIDMLSSKNFLEMVLWLIESHSMLENIRNSENQILFRMYRKNMLLESRENEIRETIWMCLVPRCGFLNVWSFLINKMIELQVLVSDESRVEHLRVKTVVKAFERRYMLHKEGQKMK